MILTYESQKSKLFLIALLIEKYCINTKIRDIAIKIIKNTKPNTIEQIKKIYDYVFYEIKYQNDIKDIDVFYNPLKTIEVKVGDCDDKTILTGTLLKTTGYEPLIVIAGNEYYSHIFSATLLNNDYIFLDTSTSKYAFNFLPSHKYSKFKIIKII